MVTTMWRLKQNGTVIDIVGNRDGVDFNKDVVKTHRLLAIHHYDANKPPWI